jgi:hypothetical protein
MCKFFEDNWYKREPASDNGAQPRPASAKLATNKEILLRDRERRAARAKELT